MLNVTQAGVRYYINAIQQAILVHNTILSNNQLIILLLSLQIFCFSSNQEMASAQVVLNDQLQKGTSGTLNNQTVETMHLIRAHSWDGRFAGVIPQIISSDGGVARFTHLKGNQGSKAAMVYAFTTATGVPVAAILGWSAPADFNPSTSPNKVFGAVGPKPAIDNMTWDQIQELVDKAGSSIVIEDGICMHATILNNPAAEMADLLANFSMCPKP
ncbi:uncharacterized protein LOC141652659 isoform X1 [Silene latifolia]|uniref:uncharacterized protein LOC141652659 isoform X1 n=1 Tax=Silene latifolia TaxID=37657 RepID=UPI003D76E48A